HVVALELAVNGHVQPNFVLPVNALGGFLFEEFFVIGGRKLPFLEASSGGANVFRLRKRTDGGGRERWQIQPRLLHRVAFGKIALALQIRWRNGFDAVFDTRIMDALALSATGNRRAVLQKSGAVAELIHKLSEQPRFRKLFLGEGEPAFEFWI